MPWLRHLPRRPADVISEIRVIGNRKIPEGNGPRPALLTHRRRLTIAASIERDFNSLWNTGYFEDVRIEREDTAKGVVLDIFVREKPTIREIVYKGNNSVSNVGHPRSLSRKRKSALPRRASTIPTRLARAETVLKELLAEHGHQFATIKEDVKTIPPASVSDDLPSSRKARP